MANRYDIHSTCPICGDAISWYNGKTNTGVEVVKTRRRSVILFHTKCYYNQYAKEKENCK